MQAGYGLDAALVVPGVDEIYRASMSSSTSITPDEIRAAAETHKELGPDYQAAVIESFLDKVGREIDARVDARMRGAEAAQYSQPAPPATRQHHDRTVFALAVISLIAGIPLSGIALSLSNGHAPSALLVVWLGIAVINVAYTVNIRRSGRR
jgi:hypothetical protein